MTTAAILASLYGELLERDVPEDLAYDLMRIAAKALTNQCGVTVKDAANV